jgi:colanic acid/amylovoran biosynthesis protein
VFCIEDLCPGVKDKQNTCFISVMDFGAKKALQPYRDAYLHFLKEQVLEQQAMGRQVVLVSFCKVEGDETGIRDLLAILPQSSRTGVQTLCYDGTNWKTICQQISACACLIATRFHSVVLGLSYAVPTVAISYSNKTLQLLKDLGHEADAILPEQLSSLDTPSPITNVCVESLKQAAQRHFEKLDQFLG